MATARVYHEAAGVDSSLLPAAAIMGAVLLWGASFTGMRIALQVFNPWAVMWLRMATALVLLFPLARRLWPRGYRPGDWRLLLPMVLFQPCAYFLLEANALCWTTSSQAGVIAASVPLMVALGAWLALGESVGRPTVVGMLVSIGGVALLTLLAAPTAAAPSPLLGNILELVAMACAAANMLMVKRLSRRYSPWTLTAMQVAAGTIFFSPGALFVWRSDAAVWRADLILVLAFLGAGVTYGAFGLYNWGMSRIPASRAAVFINLVPVVAVAFGWAVLGEGLGAGQTLAALAVVGGVAYSQR